MQHCKLLIDEDLSPKMTQRLCLELSLDAVHIRDRGMLGEPDQIVLQRAYDENRILVTANVRDFQRLAQSVELHPGIVLVLHGQLSRNEQFDLLLKTIAAIETELEQGRDMVNRTLNINGDGSFEFFDLPKPY